MPSLENGDRLAGGHRHFFGSDCAVSPGQAAVRQALSMVKQVVSPAKLNSLAIARSLMGRCSLTNTSVAINVRTFKSLESTRGLSPLP